MDLIVGDHNPLVSVVVNCYNGEDYLYSCIKSIQEQTYQNWELIFWDNASTDSSASIFLGFNDVRFRYFKSDTNVSLGQARKWAVEKCRGEYISFLDVDDSWFPYKTELQVKEMLKDDYVLSYGSIVRIDESSMKSRVSIPRYISGYLFSANMFQFEINMPSSMIKKSALLSKGLNFDESIKASEEYCLYMQLIYKEKVCVIKTPLAKYLVRSDSLTNTAIDYWSIERLYTLAKIKERNPEAALEFPDEFREAKNRAVYYKIRYNLERSNIPDARKYAREIYKESWRYFVIAILLFLSPRLLRRIFKSYYKR